MNDAGIPAIRVREATPGDREAALAVTLAAYDEYRTTGAPEWWDGYRRNVIEQFGPEQRATHIVAEADGAIIGSVLLYPASLPETDGRRVGPPEVRLLAVRPEMRGRGVARALMDACMEHARASGATAIGLHTMDIMSVAMQMYERMGFTRDPESDFYPTDDVVVKGYRLTLPHEGAEQP